MPHPHACEDAAVLPIPADSISPRPTIRSMHVPASSLNHRHERGDAFGAGASVQARPF